MGTVVSVSSSKDHNFSKEQRQDIRVVAGLGVEGDAHYGKTVQHLSRIKKNPDTPNLRQVHLIHGELFEEMAELGFTIEPGQMGENILTKGVDLLNLPEKTRLHIGDEVVLELTGLRNPCKQIDAFQKGLMHAMIDKDDQGNIIRKSGVMSVVVIGGTVKQDDPIKVVLPEGAQNPLQPV